MKRPALVLLTLLVLPGLALLATAGAQSPTPLAAAVGGNMNHVPSFVGVEKGIFLKHGIDLKLKVLATGQEMSKALQAGEVQIIGSAFSNYPVAVERGMAARGVVGMMGDRTGRYSDDPVSVWTRKGSGLTKVEDLAGKKIGTPIGGTADEYLTVLLKKNGVAEAAQYTRKNLDEAAEIATRWAPGLDAAVARKAIRHMTFDPRITPHTVAAWEENVRILIEQKKLRSALTWQQGIELRFIDKVVKSHPQLFADLKPAP
jgi:ABC-type nitrate/sulfonate/bicarbonate transport system substrate-binding protein